jgi:hypothetical protein
VCVLALPGIIPFGFHGTWRPAVPKWGEIMRPVQVIS